MRLQWLSYAPYTTSVLKISLATCEILKEPKHRGFFFFFLNGEVWKKEIINQREKEESRSGNPGRNNSISSIEPSLKNMSAPQQLKSQSFLFYTCDSVWDSLKPKDNRGRA